MSSSNYPDGAYHDPNAPWNQPDDEHFCEVCDEWITDYDEFEDICDNCLKERKENEND